MIIHTTPHKRYPLPNSYKSLIITLTFLLCYSFSFSSILLFYIIFERILIPTILIIMAWGSQPERIQASLYFLFYTIVASLPLLIVISISGGFYIRFLSLAGSPPFIGFTITSCILIRILVKFPIYFSHLWLPKAHVEAPLAASIILAAVLLKLAGYGIWRLMWIWESPRVIIFTLSCSLVGAAIAASATLIQIDLKALVAYSSVVHMRLVIASILSYSSIAIRSSLIIIVSHGVCSSGIFVIVNSFYARSQSRRIILNHGMGSPITFLLVGILLISTMNFSLPPRISLVREIIIFYTLYYIMSINISLCCIVSLYSFAFTITIYYFVFHGSAMTFLPSRLDTPKEYLSLHFHRISYIYLFISIPWYEYLSEYSLFKILTLGVRESLWLLFKI